LHVGDFENIFKNIFGVSHVLKDFYEKKREKILRHCPFKSIILTKRDSCFKFPQADGAYSFAATGSDDRRTRRGYHKQPPQAEAAIAGHKEARTPRGLQYSQVPSNAKQMPWRKGAVKFHRI
jgi:hypothetical protein